MDAAEMQYINEHAAETVYDQFASPDSPGRYGIYDEPLILPRIGYEYQVEIPELATTESQCILVESRLTSTSCMLSVGNHVGVGLDIPVTWVHHVGNATKDQQKEISCSNISSIGGGSVEYTNTEKGHADAIYSKMTEFQEESSLYQTKLLNLACKDECTDLATCRNKPDGSTSKKSIILESKMDSGVPLLLLSKAKGYRALPGTPSSSWSHNETQCFLLGLYIFGKNLVQVEKFIEFRSNQSSSIRPEIPVGTACSSLTSGDIIKFLTGDFRLSKAKSNDLFWEAVWPRLLARGWHSEQPRDISFVASKHSLVFLIPGIKKFSRKKLVKGNHYFDSVSDVLNKVASDPTLLELEAEGATGSSTTKDEDECAMDAKSDQNGLLDHQQHCFLRPRVPICNSEFMKFTIVDTSLVHGEEPFKVRELRTLPIDAISNYGPSTHTGEITSDGSEDSEDSSSDDQGDSDPDSSNNKKLKVSRKCIVGKAMQSAPSENVIAFSSTTLPTNGHILKDQCADQLNEKLPLKNMKCKFNRRAKSGQRSYLAPMAKRRRLTACEYQRTGRNAYSFSKGHQLMEEGAQLKLGAQEASGKTVAGPDPFCGKFYPDFPIYISPDKVDKCISKERCCSSTATTSKATSSDGMPQSRTLINLNLVPNVPLDYETGEQSDSEVADSQHDLNLEEAVKLSETKQQHDGSEAMENFTETLGDQKPSVNSRRQSTRNRPPTTKALEALACGFLGTKRKGRDTRALLKGNIANRSSRRVHKTAEAPAPAPAPPANTNSSEFGLSSATSDDWYTGNTHNIRMSSESCLQPDGKGTHDLLGVPVHEYFPVSNKNHDWQN
ncbi:hypothetical protein C4D60_Mb01t14730 [Musa balbisiana]|uniref:Uncharacterized protein n=1 Tax=Musa balbisiana TaxID=52838 RepID=A0A4S8JNL4_MUSBA|nr:hypothetical protein C4D60_Mb01t14730 [Musa balbisiana]